MTLPWHLPVVIGSPPAGISLTLTAGTPSVLITVGFTVTPASATLHLTAATPDVAVTANVVVSPDGAALTLSGGTPGVITPRPPITPAGAVLHLVGGRPDVGLGLIYDSYRIAALSLADYVQPVYSGTATKISRHATSNVALGTDVGDRLLPNNTFDSIDVNTANIVVDLVTGKMTVDTSGWYRLSAAIQNYYPAHQGMLLPVGNYIISLGLGLWKNGTLIGYTNQSIGYNNGSVFFGPFGLWTSFDVELAPNDYVQIGVGFGNPVQGAAAFGDPSGQNTWMSLLLLNAKVG